MKIGDKFIARVFKEDRIELTENMKEYLGLKCKLISFLEFGICYVQFENGEHFYWESSALKPI